MRFSVYVPILLAALLACGSPLVARSLTPALAARALTVASVVLGAASAWSAWLLAAAGLLRTREVAHEGRLSSSALGALDQVPRLASVAGFLILCSALAMVALMLARRRRLLRELRQLAAAGQSAGDLVMLPTSSALALALPGRRAQVLVSRGLLRALDDPERQVLLAHERSHIRHRHDLYRAACSIAGAINPLLRRVRNDVGFALERWADEDAAASVSDRSTAARALAKAALVVADDSRSTVALAFERLRVGDRVLALQANCPASRRDPVVALAGIAIFGALAAADASLALIHIAFGT